jgi:hypothetical protein
MSNKNMSSRAARRGTNLVHILKEYEYVNNVYIPLLHYFNFPICGEDMGYTRALIILILVG